MASFPSSIASLTNPTANQKMNSPSHSTIETNQNNEVVALETKVGVDGSAVTTSLDYLLKNTGSSNPGHKHSFSSLSDFSVSVVANNQILKYSSVAGAWTNQSPNAVFGGTGADGALSISSGTTTLDLGNAKVFIKNYTSISITGTGKLAFSNPNTNGTIIVLKSQGNITITSGATCIDASSMGGAPGAATTGTNQARTNGSNGRTTLNEQSATNSGATTGTGFNSLFDFQSSIEGKVIPLFCGAGGGGGGTGGSGGNGGVGGRGGGTLYMECGGAWNFTVASGISVAGAAASNGTGTDGGGGGGGAAGSFVALYTSLTANSGTVVTTAGAAGTGTGSGIGAGGGANYQSGSSSGGVGGGAGAAGLSYVAANTDFA